jgi:multicomponent Na+:H+ antiporter subunit F
MAADGFVPMAARAGIVVASALTFLCGYRVITGPTVPDRVVALDTIGMNVVAIAVLYALMTGQRLFVLVAVLLAIIGFVSTAVVAMYIDQGDIIR